MEFTALIYFFPKAKKIKGKESCKMWLVSELSNWALS